MKVHKVYKEYDLHFCVVEHNGIMFEYPIEYSFTHLFQKDIKAVIKTFYDNGETNWQDTMDSEHIKDFFRTCNIIQQPLSKRYEK